MAAIVDNRSLHWPSKACSFALTLESSETKEFTSPAYQIPNYNDDNQREAKVGPNECDRIRVHQINFKFDNVKRA